MSTFKTVFIPVDFVSFTTNRLWSQSDEKSGLMNFRVSCSSTFMAEPIHVVLQLATLALNLLL